MLGLIIFLLTHAVVVIITHLNALYPTCPYIYTDSIQMHRNSIWKKNRSPIPDDWFIYPDMLFWAEVSIWMCREEKGECSDTSLVYFPLIYSLYTQELPKPHMYVWM